MILSPTEILITANNNGTSALKGRNLNFENEYGLFWFFVILHYYDKSIINLMREIKVKDITIFQQLQVNVSLKQKVVSYRGIIKPTIDSTHETKQ